MVAMIVSERLLNYKLATPNAVPVIALIIYNLTKTKIDQLFLDSDQYV